MSDPLKEIIDGQTIKHLQAEVEEKDKTIKELKAKLNWLTCAECDHDTTCISPDKCDRNRPQP